MRRRCCRRRVKHQADLLDLYTNPLFELGSRYAQLLATVFCTLGYSSGLPVVTYIASIYCMFNYWTDKWLLLRASSRPPRYDASMTQTTLCLLIWAVPLHCAVAVVVFSNACVFPSDALTGFTSVTDEAIGRMTRGPTWMLSLMLLVFFIGVIIWLVLLAVGGSALDCLRHWAGNDACPAGVAKSFDLARPSIESKEPPASYNLSLHPDFKLHSKYLRGECSWSCLEPQPDTCHKANTATTRDVCPTRQITS